jgi:hypothetical protein
VRPISDIPYPRLVALKLPLARAGRTHAEQPTDARGVSEPKVIAANLERPVIDKIVTRDESICSTPLHRLG